MKKTLFITNPVGNWHKVIDSSGWLIAEAEYRGYECYQSTPQDLFFDGKTLRASAKKIRIPRKKNWGDPFDISLQEAVQEIPVVDFDFVKPRFDPPVDIFFIHYLQFLVPYEDQVAMVNRPSALLKWNEKLAVLPFIDLIPETKIFSSQSSSFKHSPWDETVRKVLNEAQGRGVSRYKKREEAPLDNAAKGYLLEQPFNPQIAQGDKRAFIINGHYAGGINRVPPPGDWKASIMRGAEIKPPEFTAQEEVIIERLSKWCQKEGIFLVGLDLIGERLSEVNMTSVGALFAPSVIGMKNPVEIYWDRLLDTLLGK